PSGLYYTPHIVYFIEKITNKKTNETQTYISNTNDLGKYVSQYVSGINKDVSKEIKAQVATLTAHKTSNIEKATAIFNWVQANVRYIAFEDSLGGFIPREANMVFKNKFGDCKDMT